MAFPFSCPITSQNECLEDLISYLPSLGEAAGLCDAFLLRNTWTVKPVDRYQVADELLPMFYKDRSASTPDHVTSELLHNLALLFMVMSCGLCMVAEEHDVDIIAQMDHYYQLARASLCLGRVVENGSVAGCQTLLMFAVYANHKSQGPPGEWGHRFIGLALSLASNVSLS